MGHSNYDLLDLLLILQVLQWSIKLVALLPL